MEKKSVIIRVPDALYEQLKHSAEENDRTVNAEIVRLIRQHLESQKRELAQEREGEG